MGFSKTTGYGLGSALCIGVLALAAGCGGNEGHTTGSTGTAGTAGTGGSGATGGTGGSGATGGSTTSTGATGGSTTSSGGTGGTGGSTTSTGGGPPKMPEALYVAHEGAFAAYDVATGELLGMSIPNVSKPFGMQALEDGMVLTNLTASNEIQVVDAHKQTEVTRTPSSGAAGTRPVDSYVSPDQGGGKRYWLALNDGNQSAGTYTASLVDLTVGSPTRFQRLSEVPLGNGHHQAAFSATKSRFVASSFTDCDNVFTVFDFTDPKAVTSKLTVTAKDLGYDGSTLAKTCDPTDAAGTSLKPHGCGTSKMNGKVYCNMATVGTMVILNVDADPPTFTTLALPGKGGGYTKPVEGGAYIYTLQASVKEGAGGVDCQVGQLVTVDAKTDAVVSTLPLLYKGPDCKDKLAGTDEETVGPNHIRITPDGKRMFVALAGGFGVATARVRYHVAVDLTNPAAPVQLPSIKIGQASAQRGSAISGDGSTLYVADTVDGTVTAIDTATLAVKKTYKVLDNPLQVATFGDDAGPSMQIGPVY